MNAAGLYVQAESFQNLLISVATGGVESDTEYLKLRPELLGNPTTAALLPRFVQTNRNTAQFWQFIKHEFKSYAERRRYIWDQFRALLDALERGGIAPADAVVSGLLTKFDAEHVNAAWAKALERRSNDPEGAITSARTLLESVCKHVLDTAKVPYDDKDDLPQLYKKTAKLLNLAPSQHTEEVFKQILGGCTAVVEGLGTLRNRLSDAHGKGKIAARPLPRHAELAVNLSGALAMYLLSTWNARDGANVESKK